MDGVASRRKTPGDSSTVKHSASQPISQRHTILPTRKTMGVRIGWYTRSWSLENDADTHTSSERAHGSLAGDGYLAARTGATLGHRIINCIRTWALQIPRYDRCRNMARARCRTPSKVFHARPGPELRPVRPSRQPWGYHRPTQVWMKSTSSLMSVDSSSREVSPCRRSHRLVGWLPIQRRHHPSP